MHEQHPRHQRRIARFVCSSSDARRAPSRLRCDRRDEGRHNLSPRVARRPTEVWGVPVKEPHFFSQDWVWERGVNWYRNLFVDAPAGSLAGESSTSYSDPRVHRSSCRADGGALIPDARLIYVVRHPIDRLRSDYVHSVGEARQVLPLDEALLDPDCGHVARSMYDRVSSPFRRRFSREQILVVTFEDLVRPRIPLGRAILAHLQLAPRPAPATRHNATDERRSSPQLKRWLRRTGLLGVARRLPASARQAATRVAPSDRRTDEWWRRPRRRYRTWSRPRSGRRRHRLEVWLGVTTPLWEPRSPTAVQR